MTHQMLFTIDSVKNYFKASEYKYKNVEHTPSGLTKLSSHAGLIFRHRTTKARYCGLLLFSSLTTLGLQAGR